MPPRGPNRPPQQPRQPDVNIIRNRLRDQIAARSAHIKTQLDNALEAFPGWFELDKANPTLHAELSQVTQRLSDIKEEYEILYDNPDNYHFYDFAVELRRKAEEYEVAAQKYEETVEKIKRFKVVYEQSPENWIAEEAERVAEFEKYQDALAAQVAQKPELQSDYERLTEDIAAYQEMVNDAQNAPKGSSSMRTMLDEQKAELAPLRQRIEEVLRKIRKALLEARSGIVAPSEKKPETPGSVQEWLSTQQADLQKYKDFIASLPAGFLDFKNPKELKDQLEKDFSKLSNLLTTIGSRGAGDSDVLKTTFEKGKQRVETLRAEIQQRIERLSELQDEYAVNLDDITSGKVKRAENTQAFETAKQERKANLERINALQNDYEREFAVHAKAQLAKGSKNFSENKPAALVAAEAAFAAAFVELQKSAIEKRAAYKRFSTVTAEPINLVPGARRPGIEAADNRLATAMNRVLAGKLAESRLRVQEQVMRTFWETRPNGLGELIQMKNEAVAKLTGNFKKFIESRPGQIAADAVDWFVYGEKPKSKFDTEREVTRRAKIAVGVGAAAALVGTGGLVGVGATAGWVATVGGGILARWGTKKLLSPLVAGKERELATLNRNSQKKLKSMKAEDVATLIAQQEKLGSSVWRRQRNINHASTAAGIATGLGIGFGGVRTGIAGTIDQALSGGGTPPLPERPSFGSFADRHGVGEVQHYPLNADPGYDTTTHSQLTENAARRFAEMNYVDPATLPPDLPEMGGADPGFDTRSSETVLRNEAQRYAEMSHGEPATLPAEEPPLTAPTAEQANFGSFADRHGINDPQYHPTAADTGYDTTNPQPPMGVADPGYDTRGVPDYSALTEMNRDEAVRRLGAQGAANTNNLYDINRDEGARRFRARGTELPSQTAYEALHGSEMAPLPSDDAIESLHGGNTFYQPETVAETPLRPQFPQQVIEVTTEHRRRGLTGILERAFKDNAEVVRGLSPVQRDMVRDEVFRQLRANPELARTVGISSGNIDLIIAGKDRIQLHEILRMVNERADLIRGTNSLPYPPFPPAPPVPSSVATFTPSLDIERAILQTNEAVRPGFDVRIDPARINEAIRAEEVLPPLREMGEADPGFDTRSSETVLRNEAQRFAEMNYVDTRDAVGVPRAPGTVPSALSTPPDAPVAYRGFSTPTPPPSPEMVPPPGAPVSVAGYTEVALTPPPPPAPPAVAGIDGPPEPVRLRVAEAPPAGPPQPPVPEPLPATRGVNFVEPVAFTTAVESPPKVPAEDLVGTPAAAVPAPFTVPDVSGVNATEDIPPPAPPLRVSGELPIYSSDPNDDLFSVPIETPVDPNEVTPAELEEYYRNVVPPISLERMTPGGTEFNEAVYKAFPAVSPAESLNAFAQERARFDAIFAPPRPGLFDLIFSSSREQTNPLDLIKQESVATLRDVAKNSTPELAQSIAEETHSPRPQVEKLLSAITQLLNATPVASTTDENLLTLNDLINYHLLYRRPEMEQLMRSL